MPWMDRKRREDKRTRRGPPKGQQFTIADKMGSSTATENIQEKLVEPIEFEVSKMGWEVHDYFKSNNTKSFDVTIWFNGRIDRNTGKIIYFELGRLDPQREIDGSS